MTPAANRRGLDGIGVLVTRPAGQSEQLARLISAEGGTPILFPALEIEGLPEAEIAAALGAIDAVDLAVFVSPNAVRFGLAALAHGAGPGFAVRYAAIGPGTVAELKKGGVREIMSPESGFDSEALLALLPLDEMAGKRVVIFRGNGGRELLSEVLQSRGASVTHIACYRRKRPPGDMRVLLSLWQSGGLQACIATSAEIVSNLLDMAGEAARPRLCQTPMFVPHARVAATAFAGSVRTLFVAGAGDIALVRGLLSWFATPRTEAAASNIFANPS